MVYTDSYIVCFHTYMLTSQSVSVGVGVGVDVCQSVSGVASVSVKC